MACLRKTRISGQTYIYICKSVRKGKKVSGKVLEYLGREDRIDPARLRAALKYWKVGGKRKAKKKGGK